MKIYFKKNELRQVMKLLNIAIGDLRIQQNEENEITIFNM
jgi:hypothetical protein